MPVVLLTGGDDAPAPLGVAPVVPPTDAATPTPTALATSSPTAFPFLYDPPDDAQCFAISSGNPISGEGDLQPAFFEVTKEVDYTSSPDQDVNALVQELEDAMQQILAPAIARCPDAETQVLARLQDQALLSIGIFGAPGGLRGGNGRRGLQEQSESEFVVRNVDMNSKVDDTSTCATTPDTGEECIVVSTLVTLFLAGPEEEQILVDRIEETFIAGLTIANLGLTEVFTDIRFIRGVAPTDGSEAPSLTPSLAPSTVPSASSAPSLTGTPAPTALGAPGQPTSDGGKGNTAAKRQALVEPALATMGSFDKLNQNALEWMLNEDWWLPDAPFAASTDVWIHRYVMRVVYQETGGENWLKKDGWLGGSSICRGWYGISCVDSDSDLISGLDLDGNQLNGRIPTELGLLTPLQDLSLATNYLNGAIPSEIGKLTSLRTMNLVDTNLEGPIPNEVAGLQAVKQVSFGN